MNIKAVDRAIAIYESLADSTEPRGARDKLASHLASLYSSGEHDDHRLTVHGLTFLQQFETMRNS